jgi:nucleoporin SEH1
MVTDVAWAPNMGRSYQLIATASKDGIVRIFKLTDKDKASKASASKSGKWHVTLVAAFDDHKAEVWKVEWNILGNILSSSGDDGKVRLWSCKFLNVLQCGHDGKSTHIVLI